MTWAVTADVERYDEAVDWFRARKVVLSPELHGLAARDSFWVGAGLQLSQIESVFGKIEAAIEKGETFEEWRKTVRGELKNDAHAETVYRNAVQRAYNAGRYEQMSRPDVLRFRPFWMFEAILDARSSVICPICNGTILEAGHPWWSTHIPPLHHRCRSSIRNMRRSEAERRGITTAAPDTSSVRAPGEWGDAPGALKAPKPTPKDPALGKSLEKKAKAKTPPPVSPLPISPPAPAAPAQTRLTRQSARAMLEELEAPEWNFKNHTRVGYGAKVRSWIHRMLEDHGVPTMDENQGLFVDNRLTKMHALGAAVMSGEMKGLTLVSPKAWRTLKTELKKFAAGKANEAPSVEVLIHEEIHHASAAGASFLKHKPSSLVEEVATEVLAQRIAVNVGAIKEPLKVSLSPDGQSYQLSRNVGYRNQIQTVVGDVATALGIDAQAALERIADAGVFMRTLGAAGKSNLDGFIDGLKIKNPEQRDRLHRRLSLRTL